MAGRLGQGAGVVEALTLNLEGVEAEGGESGACKLKKVAAFHIKFEGQVIKGYVRHCSCRLSSSFSSKS